MKTYEVELRALLSQDQYESLIKHFSSLANGEEDNTETYTFLTPNLNIKVKKQISQKKAKITVKTGAEYEQHVDEFELPIKPEDIEKAVKLVTALGFSEHIESLQKRINYNVDDIVVSLKHETYWKYHMEAEIVVNDEKDILAAKEKLHSFFKELEIVPMTEEETRTLINSLRIKFGMEKI